MGDEHRIIPPHGGYENLKSYQMAEIVYDATVKFCEHYRDRRSRTVDQMVQAARSGKQNIAEGSMVSGTSKKLELKVVGVARASLEELLNDYRDFLRQRGLALWGKDHPGAKEVRALAYSRNRSYTIHDLLRRVNSRSRRQCHHLHHPSGQLPAGPAAASARGAISPGRRHHRADVSHKERG